MKYVYLAKAGSDYKVGIAMNVTERIKQLQTSNPNKISVVMTRLVEDAYRIEQATHKFVDKMRSGGGTEWFTLQPEEAIELAIYICENPEIDVAEEITVRSLLNRQNEIQRLLDTRLSKVLTKQHIRAEDTKAIIMPNDLPVFKKKLLSTKSSSPSMDDNVLMVLALNIFKTEGKASTSLLQRKLKIGYGRAARIMDLLEQSGSISGWNGQSIRQVIAE